jgi:hypothetical protein
MCLQMAMSQTSRAPARPASSEHAKDQDLLARLPVYFHLCEKHEHRVDERQSIEVRKSMSNEVDKTKARSCELAAQTKK